MASESDGSKDMLSQIMHAKFDDSILTQNQAIVFNLDHDKIKNKNFRMNERIFNEKLASFKGGEGVNQDVFGIKKKLKKC